MFVFQYSMKKKSLLISNMDLPSHRRQPSRSRRADGGGAGAGAGAGAGGDGDGNARLAGGGVEEMQSKEAGEEDYTTGRWWSVDAYSSDEFRMYVFKVRRCMRVRSHDWTDCPFAHPGEKARRRDPRRYQYSGIVCPAFRRDGSCGRGDACEFSHGVFECWLHPSRYRTMPCKDGQSCRRKVCFFAHSPGQLRPAAINATTRKTRCIFLPKPMPSCGSTSCSPTSTLTGFPYSSPPPSPSSSDVAVRARNHSTETKTLENYVYTGLVKSMEAMYLSSTTTKLGLFWPSTTNEVVAKAPAPAPAPEQDSGPDLDWVNELVM